MTTIATVGAPTALPQDITRLGILKSSFGKFKRGEALSPEDRLFLRENSWLDPSLSDRFFSCFSTNHADRRAEEINNIAEGILAHRRLSRPLLDQIETLFLRETRETPQVVASLSRLLTALLVAKKDFSAELSCLRRDLERAPTRLDLIVLVNRCNAVPDLTKARTEAALIDDIAIKYDEKGFLRIEQGCLTPIDIECSQKLTRERVEAIKRLYAEMTSHISYNNLGEMLEFNHYYKEEKATDPTLTLDKAITSYTPDLPGIFAKYHSGGTCLLLSVSFRAELAKMGIKAESTGYRGTNRWSELPLPNCPEIFWEAFSRGVSYIPHTRTSCFYRDERNRKQVLIFEGSFDADTSREVKEILLDQLLYDYSKQYPEREDPSAWARSQIPFQVPDAIADPSVIYKGRLKGRFKAVMESITDCKKILGVDFLRGNFYINPSWSKTLTGLPLNEKGVVSILLTDLARSDEGGTYFIDRERKEMTHREALKIILDKTKDGLYFPEDFEENLVALAENTDDLFTDFFLEPMQTIRHLYEDFLTLTQKIYKAREKAITQEEVLALQLIENKFDDLVRDIRGNREADAREKLNALLADPILSSDISL